MSESMLDEEPYVLSMRNVIAVPEGQGIGLVIEPGFSARIYSWGQCQIEFRESQHGPHSNFLNAGQRVDIDATLRNTLEIRSQVGVAGVCCIGVPRQSTWPEGQSPAVWNSYCPELIPWPMDAPTKDQIRARFHKRYQEFGFIEPTLMENSELAEWSPASMVFRFELATPYYPEE